jgi:hypothetical protein
MAGPGLDTEIAENLAPGDGAPGDAAPAAPESTLDIARAALNDQKDRAEGEEGHSGERGAERDRARAPDGKFTPRTDKPAPDRTAAPPAAQTPPVAAAAAPDPNAPVVERPPGGWSPQSKVDFDKLPPHIKADIVKREREIEQGFSKLALFKPVEKYHEMALKGGTTLDKALEQYVGIEQELRRDIFAGVTRVLANVGIKDPRQFLVAWSQRLSGNQPPGAPPNPQPAPTNQTVDPQKIAAQIRQELAQEAGQKERLSVVETFAADPSNRFYANVEAKIPGILSSGVIDATLPLKDRLQAAYDMACYADPAIRPHMGQVPARRIVNAQAADQARRQAKAITGAPARGIPAASAPKVGQTAIEIAREALAAQKGARI